MSTSSSFFNYDESDSGARLDSCMDDVLDDPPVEGVLTNVATSAIFPHQSQSTFAADPGIPEQVNSSTGTSCCVPFE